MGLRDHRYLACTYHVQAYYGKIMNSEYSNIELDRLCISLE